jgi:hypothetical protein
MRGKRQKSKAAAAEVASARSPNEVWYDNEIAPALLAISLKCEARGVALVAVVEYNPGERGGTYCMPSSAGLAMVMLRHCAKMGENVDGYMIGLIRYANDKGIDTKASIYMHAFEYRYCHRCAAKMPPPAMPSAEPAGAVEEGAPST